MTSGLPVSPPTLQLPEVTAEKTEAQVGDMLYLKWGALGQEGHFMEKSPRASRHGDFKENPCAKLF